MNRYPVWVNVTVILVMLLGVLVALPNIYGKAPALQIAMRDNSDVTEELREQIEQAISASNLEADASYLEDGRLIVRFLDGNAQKNAKVAVAELLDKSAIIALTLEPRTPEWLRNLGLKPMNLGLDLRGGVHFLYEVDMNEATRRDMQRFASDFKKTLRDENIRYQRVSSDIDRVLLTFATEEQRSQARKALGEFSEQINVDLVDGGGEFALEAAMTDQQIKERRDFAISQNMTTLRNRVNELGVAEPVVQRQGVDRILVQLPGVQDPAQAERILGATATVEFRLVSEGDAFAVASGSRPPIGTKLFTFRDDTPILLERDIIASGDDLSDARTGFDQQSGSPAVYVRLEGQGARSMLETTKENVGSRMAVVFIEQGKEFYELNGEQRERIVVSEKVINAATIQGVFGSNFQITGLDSTTEASDLALLLRAGALATPIYKVEERTIGPSLGQDNIDKGSLAVMIGFLAVIIFMAFYYRVFGLFANMALLANLVLIVALLSMFQAALTLPGIAGIVLTVGMAVDANVLIFERIREELRNGSSPQASIHAGYEKAFSSIADANVTTLIAALVLFVFGTGPIRGFAVTLSFGIVTSMFTSIIGTRALANWVYGGRNIKKVAI